MGRRGPAPTPTKVKRLRGETRPSRLNHAEPLPHPALPRMPADMDAWRRAGLKPVPPGVFENSQALSDPKLGFLGDIFAIPASWPLSNVFSIGDVLIVIGGTYLAHRVCAVPTERLELSLTRT